MFEIHKCQKRKTRVFKHVLKANKPVKRTWWGVAETERDQGAASHA